MSAELETQLRAWVEAELGIPVTELSLIPGGASRRSYKVLRADAPPVFLRVDSGEGPLSGTQFTLAREWSFLKPIADRGYPAPGVLAFSAELNAILMEHIEGQTSYQASLPPTEQRAMERALIDCVVDLQRIPPTELGVAEYAGIGTVGQAVSNILGVWQQLYTDTVSFKDPAVDYALEWLKHNVPDAGDPAVLVHGDVGPGNFLFRPNGEIAALIDWELVRVGHPLEDLACILCRALGVSFGAPEQLVADFAASSGKNVDRRALDYAVVLVIGEWCVGIHRALSRPNVQLDMAMLYIWGHANRYEMLKKLAGLAGRALPEEPPLDEAPFELDFIGTYIEESLSSVLLPAAKEVFVSHRVGRLLQLQKIQDSLLRYGRRRYEEEDIERAGALLGQRFESHADALSALVARAPAAARDGDTAFLDFLLWRAVRERALLRRAMGEMAARSITY